MCFIQLVGSELIIPPNYEKFYRHVQCGRITLPQKYSMTGFVISLNALFQAVLGRRKSPPQFYWNYGGLMVGVARLKLAASASQMRRAINCATPRYAIKLWSCKWSNMWSGTNLTAFLIFTNCPKSAPLKGFRRFFFSGTEWEIYAPKCGALSTALHPDSY